MSDEEIFHRDLEYQIRNDIVNVQGEGIQVYRNGSSHDYYLWIYQKGCDEAKIVISWNFSLFRYYKSYWIANYWEEVPYDRDGSKDNLGATRRGPDSFNYFIYEIASALLPHVMDGSLQYAELCEENRNHINNISYFERKEKRKVIVRLADKPIGEGALTEFLYVIESIFLDGYHGLSSNIQKGLQVCLTDNPQLHLRIKYREFYGDYYDTLPDEEDFIRHERILLLKHPLSNWEFDRMSMVEVESYNPYTDVRKSFQCDTEPSKQQLELYNELLEIIFSYILEYGSKRSIRTAELTLESEWYSYYEGGKVFEIICIKDKDII